MQVETAGAQWFDMPAPELTDELKKDLHILRSRGVLDPKRHYKKQKDLSLKYFQVGTIIQGPTEYYSARLTKKERKDNLVEELMADVESRKYFKKQYSEIQEKKSKFTKRGIYRRKGRR
jgi:hypothetical protein